MNFGSVCSGIEAASVAWEPLGWRCAFVSEIEPYPCAVLAHHYPTVANRSDMTRFKEWPDADLDVLVGGTPCQSFSVAGLRAGLADPRGNLLLTYLAIADRYRPDWLVWENVPGVFSATSHDAPDPCAPTDDVAEGTERVVEDRYDADETHALWCFLAGLSELGYGWAYRVLDAQYDGLAQRRERVFVVASTRGWEAAAAVLFESASLRGDLAPSRQSREGIAASLTSGSHPGSNAPGRRREDDTNLIAGTLTRSTFDGSSASGGDGRDAFMVAHTLRAEGFDATDDGTGRGIPMTVSTLCEAGGHARPGDNIQSVSYLIPEVANPLTARMAKGVNSTADEGQTMIAFDTTQITNPDNRSNPQPGDPCHPLAAAGHAPAIAGTAVRRLTPRECERLQGFPDDYTLIPYRGKPAKDGPRYKALGNSMAVPVMRWIGSRIAMVDELLGGAGHEVETDNDRDQRHAG